jgi:hypothetical protein
LERQEPEQRVVVAWLAREDVYEILTDEAVAGAKRGLRGNEPTL